MTATAEPQPMNDGAKSTELVPVVQAPVTLFRTENPNEVVTRAAETANALAAVVKAKKLTARIQGRDFPLVEAWTLCGTMLGVYPICVWSRKLENGWEARVEARTLAGNLVGAAEAQCTRSEKTWATRDDYALRSMAQTRATSKALRQPLGFVMTLAGFESTPAEEMIVDAEVREGVTTTPDMKLIAEVDARIAVLGPTDPGWTMEATLAAATRSFGRRIGSLTDMTDDELRQILAAMPKATA